MNDEKITVKFIDKFQNTSTIICKPEEKLYEICQKFASENGIDFKNFHFSLKEYILGDEDRDKTIAHFISEVGGGGGISIKISKITKIDKGVPDTVDHTSNHNGDSIPNGVNIDDENPPLANPVASNPIESKVVETNKNNVNAGDDKQNSVNPNVNINVNPIDKQNPPVEPSSERGPIQDKEITVVFSRSKSCHQELKSSLKNKLSDISQNFADFNKCNVKTLDFFHRGQKLNLAKTIEEIVNEAEINAGKIELNVEENTCFKRHKIKFLIGFIAAIVLIVVLIVVLVVVLKKEKKKKNEKEQQPIINPIICDDGCLDCFNSQECYVCKENFELYNKKCIQYAFVVTYNNTMISNSTNWVQIFNRMKIHNLFAMKINDYNSLVNPYSEYILDKSENNKIYFYLNKESHISLSSLFENIPEIIDFSFNNESINNFIITDINRMFSGCTSLKNISFFPFKGEYLVDISYIFSNCTSLEYIDLSSFNSSNLKYMEGVFYNCISLSSIEISNLDTGKVTTISSMFYNCNSLNSININNFNTSNVEDMSNMFYNCNSLNTLNITNFNTNNVVYLFGMFSNCYSLSELNLSNFHTINVVDMNHMFYNCYSLTSLKLYNFNIENVISMGYMFYNCSVLFSLDIPNFNSKNVINMDYMFYNCYSLTSLNLNNFDTDNVISLSYMFYNCSSLKFLNPYYFSIQNAKYIDHMFYDCHSLSSLSLSNFDGFKIINMNYMFYNCYLLESLSLYYFYDYYIQTWIICFIIVIH